MSKKSKRVAESTLDAKTIVDAFIERPALLNEVMEQMQLLMTAMNEQKQATEWYRVFESEYTTITLKTNTVEVKIARGHAGEFKPQLKAAGFSWGQGIKSYWAWLDDEERAEVARHNAEMAELYKRTEGMTSEQKKAFWAEYHAARKARKSA